MSELYFIRHGQASFGSDNYDLLSPKGVLQARILGQHLAGLGVKFDALYSGHMDRQKQTARQVMMAYAEKKIFLPDPVNDKAWDEVDSKLIWDAQVGMMVKEEPGLLDELNRDRHDKKAFQKVFSRVMDRWVSGDFDAPGLVTWKGYQNRVVQGLNRLVQTGGPSRRIAVFSSGGPISTVVQAALGLSNAKALEILWQVMNASVTRLKYEGRHMSLSGFNDITHLELKGDRTLITYR